MKRRLLIALVKSLTVVSFLMSMSSHDLWRLETVTGTFVEGEGVEFALGDISQIGTMRVAKVWKQSGFTYLGGSDGRQSFRMLFIPGWFFVAVAFVGGLIWFVDARNQRKSLRWSAANLCSICGYDLRATPDRCPECGTVPAGKEIVSN